MNYQIAIYSADEIFSQMIELEFLLLGKEILRAAAPPEDAFADVVILDLDTAPAPAPDSYRRMIGFTRTPALSADDARRQCSLILHRPFEIRLLRMEVLGSDANLSRAAQIGRVSAQAAPKRISLNREKGIVMIDGVSVRVSQRERSLLELLIRERGNAVSRERLGETVGDAGTNKVDVYICYLRRKFEAAVGAPLIATVRGKGYCLK